MNDRTFRAISEEQSLRGAAIVCTGLVRDIVSRQPPVDIPLRMLGELIAGTLLVRQTMAPDQRVQATLRRRAGGSIFADSFPDGMTRALCTVPRGVEFVLGDDTLLQVSRVLDNGELQTGTVVTAPEKGLSASFTTYMMNSEQITTAVQLGCLYADDQIEAVGGWMLQVLPDHDDAIVAAALNRIQEAPPIEELLRENLDPADIFGAVVAPLRFKTLAEEPVRFGCNCSEERVLNALRTIGRDAIAELASSDEPIEIGCDYCGTQYELEPGRIGALI
jgi:molecular chaperone Hsp33